MAVCLSAETAVVMWKQTPQALELDDSGFQCRPVISFLDDLGRGTLPLCSVMSVFTSVKEGALFSLAAVTFHEEVTVLPPTPAATPVALASPGRKGAM